MSDRYQREIEDLLRKMDARSLHEPLPRRISRRTASVRSGVRQTLRGFLRRAPVEQFMIASIVLVLGALVFGLVNSVVASAVLSQVVYWASVLGLLFFVLALGMSIAGRQRGGGADYEPRWRGQMVDFRPRNQGLWDRVRGWFRRR